MASSLDLNYEWMKQFDTKDEASETAQYFHEVLRGNPDYIDSNIILSWNNDVVVLTEFEGSSTHIHVNEEGGKYILELFKK